MKYVLGLVLLVALVPSSEKKSFTVLVSDITWESMQPPGVPKGLEQRVLHDNKENQLISAIVKFPKGFRYTSWGKGQSFTILSEKLM